MHIRANSSSQTLANAILAASLVVASTAAPALAQYMVIDGVSSSPSAFKETVCCRTIYVQDYNNFSGVSDSQTKDELTSTAIINELFENYLGVFSAFIGIPAIIIAALRLFVKKQQQPQRKEARRSLELPAAPNASSFYRPAPARNC